MYQNEIVVYPDMTKSPIEIQRQLNENAAAKLQHSARREQERFDAPCITDKILDCIDKMHALYARMHTHQR